MRKNFSYHDSLENVITGILFKSSRNIPQSLLSIFVYEVDKRSIELYGRRVTDIQYTKSPLGPPNSKEIDDCIEDLLSKDVLREVQLSEETTFSNGYGIDYYSKAESAVESLSDRAVTAIEMALERFENCSDEEIIDINKDYSEIKNKKSYTPITLE